MRVIKEDEDIFSNEEKERRGDSLICELTERYMKLTFPALPVVKIK